MSKFTTNIKTAYTSMQTSSGKKTFVSTYSNKNGRKTIAGENRNIGKKFASQLMK